MRRRMIRREPFTAGVFIGGMEGVEIEYIMFRNEHPTAKLLPVASTGGAALEIFKREPTFSPMLKSDLAYPSLFRKLLNFLDE
jgi:SLOG cluster3 family